MYFGNDGEVFGWEWIKMVCLYYFEVVIWVCVSGDVYFILKINFVG